MAARRRWVDLRRFTIDHTTITRLGAAGAVLLALAAAAWLWTPSTVAADGSSSAPVDAPLPAAITVHVTGEVVRPGLVDLTAGSRIADAIAAAGGTLPSADLGALNLAAPVRDGERVHIGAEGPGGESAPVLDDGLVHLNEASAADLERLPGVGPVLAARILDHRDQHGPFAAPEDLLDVPGIGEGRLEAMRDVIAIP